MTTNVVVCRTKKGKAMNPTTVSPKELAELQQAGSGIDLIDVRMPVEYREVHVEFARNIPLDQLDPTAVM